MKAELTQALTQLRELNLDTFRALLGEKLRPPYDYHGLLLLRERAGRERDLRELYRGRAPYELLQNADDVGAKHAAFVLHPEGLAFLHDGDWFNVRDFQNLAQGWSDKDPNVCIGHKGLGFRAVLDITPIPCVFRIDGPQFFGVKFSYALNKGHFDEAFRQKPDLRKEFEDLGRTCPIMSIPGEVKRQTLSPGLNVILSAAAQGGYGAKYTTAFWMPARDPELSGEVLRRLDPLPMVLDTGRQPLREFIQNEVTELILFLQHVLEVRLYEERTLAASVSIPGRSRQDIDEGSVTTEIDGKQQTRRYFQVRASRPIPPHIRNEPGTSATLRSMESARVAVLVEIKNDRPVASLDSRFHVYFPTEERTGFGFIVHGDFYVKPDRTRLMTAGYNDWLLREAANLAAGPFLTHLLERYQPRVVFEALRPINPGLRDSATSRFREALRQALNSRPEPFVPTSHGRLKPDDVVIPAEVDDHGIWQQLFAKGDGSVREGKKFLLPTDDSSDARGFLLLAGVEQLSASAFVDLVESVGGEGQSPNWWFACYEYMAADAELSRWPTKRFVGRHLIPVGGGGVVQVRDDSFGKVMVLSPRGGTALTNAPAAFASLIEFTEPGLAELLWKDGSELTRNWMTSQFHIANYEVTEFLPRVVRATASSLFRSPGTPSVESLVDIWWFVRRSIDAAARPIDYELFWEAIGRLPLPLLIPDDPSQPVRPGDLVPAFLTYFPDEWLPASSPLLYVEGVRRVDPRFLALLSRDVDAEQNAWRELLGRIGVSAYPKHLQYRRIVPGAPLLIRTQATVSSTTGFRGDRQEDENRAFLQLVQAEQLWPALAAGVIRCSLHPQDVMLSSATVFEGLAPVVAKAQQEYDSGEGNWSSRLQKLIRSLPSGIDSEEDSTACQNPRCTWEGRARSLAATQLDRYRWVPTTFGPWVRSGAFLRLTGHRLVGLEPDGTELGDRLLPYAVAETVEDYALLEALGVPPLSDASSASPNALVGFLVALGRALASDSAAEGVLSHRSRWRLIRGAIQEVYRALNRQPRNDLRVPDELHLAVRSESGASFQCAPWFFAEPGSVLEKAFAGNLSLIDADRWYSVVFGEFGVTRLVPGETVQQRLVESEGAEDADQLRREIVTLLGPHLLSVVVGRADRADQAELAARRLRERFSVRTARSLRLMLALEDGSNQVEMPVEPFYLERSVLEAQGSRQEANYTLYAVADSTSHLLTLDPDALGVALAPVLLGEMSEELAGLLPRIVARFQLVGGDRDKLQRFLLDQLNISQEAQETARGLVEAESIPEITASAPRIVGPTEISSQGDIVVAREAALAALEQTMQAEQSRIAERLGAPTPGAGRPAGQRTPGGFATHGVTPEQEMRGRRGEDEVKRRLEEPAGWAGFHLLEDRRQDGCGYDFLCSSNFGVAKLEVKTFEPDGQVLITLRELQEASASGHEYYLVGIRDDSGPPQLWETFLVHNPLVRLLDMGTFQIDTRLQAPAETFFGNSDD